MAKSVALITKMTLKSCNTKENCYRLYFVSIQDIKTYIKLLRIKIVIIIVFKALTWYRDLVSRFGISMSEIIYGVVYFCFINLNSKLCRKLKNSYCCKFMADMPEGICSMRVGGEKCINNFSRKL
jgi:hypothetical protein